MKGDTHCKLPSLRSLHSILDVYGEKSVRALTNRSPKEYTAMPRLVFSPLCTCHSWLKGDDGPVILLRPFLLLLPPKVSQFCADAADAMLISRVNRKDILM